MTPFLHFSSHILLKKTEFERDLIEKKSLLGFYLLVIVLFRLWISAASVKCQWNCLQRPAWCSLVVSCQGGLRLRWQRAGADWGGLPGVRTVQILIAENRQLVVPSWCRVAAIHREQKVIWVVDVRGRNQLIGFTKTLTDLRLSTETYVPPLALTGCESI